MNNEDIFFIFTDIFSENTTSADMKTFFFSSSPIFSGKNRTSLEPLIV